MSEPMLFAVESWLLAPDGRPGQRTWRFTMSGEWWVDWQMVVYIAAHAPGTQCDPMMVAVARLLLAGRAALVEITWDQSEAMGRAAAAEMTERMRAEQQEAARHAAETDQHSGQTQALGRTLH